MRRACSALLGLAPFLTARAGGDAAGPCDCTLPTPCKSRAGCTIPLLTNIEQCPEQTRDCRSELHDVCGSAVQGREGLCCWTVCSSLAIRRTCGQAPNGFVFDKPGVRNGTECHDPLNVREKCCLRERKRMRSITPRSPQCPELGSDLVKIFETVDGNGANAPNSVISGVELLDSLEWLNAKGYLFLAENFTSIDIDGNARLSWYEVELFCGLRGARLPPEDIFQVKPSEITMIASQPLLIAGLLSTLVVGELVGLLQVVARHAMHLDAEPDDDGQIIRGSYTALAYIWPVIYCLFQLYYWFRKIDWEVCDPPQSAISFWGRLHMDAMSVIKAEYLGFVLLNCCVVAASISQWVFARKCPLSPTKDIERRIYLQQAVFRKYGKAYEFVFIAVHAFAAIYILNRVIFYGTLCDITWEGWAACKREEPDLALLYNVNERFLMWRVVSVCVLNLYVQLGWGINHKTNYAPLPAGDALAGTPRDARIGLVNSVLDKEQGAWKYFE